VKTFIHAAFLLFVALALYGCGGNDISPETDDTGLTKVSLQLNWFPEAEHGGFYAAQVHGYFEDEGLKVEIMPGGPNSPVVAQVDTGRATFGVINADKLLMGRDAGPDLVCLLAPIQTSPRCILVHEDSGIETFEQLSDVTLALSSGSSFYPYLKKHAALKNVKIVAYSGSVAPFLNDKRYAQQAYVFSEPFMARQVGAKTRNLMAADLGFNPYASTLVATRKTVDERPDITQKMARACQRGWEQYLKDPSETNKLIADLNKEMSIEILEFGATELAALCDTGDSPLGSMTADRWKTLAQQMHEAEMLKSPNANGAFSLDFLK
jgi:NitT/TauT family transport system substrate-binding protein